MKRRKLDSEYIYGLGNDYYGSKWVLTLIILLVFIFSYSEQA